MSIGNMIASLRKQKGLTQEALANSLGVTNQAVSKWESDQSCPDILLLPAIADLFGITLDALFGRSTPASKPQSQELPWEDDNTLRAVVFKGHTYLANMEACREMHFLYGGDVLNLECVFDCTIEGEVQGNVTAGGGVECEAVAGDVTAGGDVECGDVAGNVKTGGDVDCGKVLGHVGAGRDVDCGDVEGNVSAGGDVDCGAVAGSVAAGGDVDSGTIVVNTKSDRNGGFFWKNNA